MTDPLVVLPAAFRGIPFPEDLVRITPVRKGWSREEKFRLDTASGGRLLLRLRRGQHGQAHRLEYAFVKNLAACGLPVPAPRGFGVLQGGSWMLLDWAEGADLDAALPDQPEDLQYRLGTRAGRILRRIHATPAPEGTPPHVSVKPRALSRAQRFLDAGIKLEGGEQTARFIRDRLDWLERLPCVPQHGDFHPGNLILTPAGDLLVIDFNRWGMGDPAEEFYKLQSFTIESSVPFARGQIDGYFEGPAPDVFWQALAVHVAVSSLYSILWAAPFGPEEVAGMVRRCERAWKDYQGYTAVVPLWYAGS